MTYGSEAGSEAGSGVMGSGSTVSTSAMVPVLLENEGVVVAAVSKKQIWKGSDVENTIPVTDIVHEMATVCVEYRTNTRQGVFAEDGTNC